MATVSVTMATVYKVCTLLSHSAKEDLTASSTSTSEPFNIITLDTCTHFNYSTRRAILDRLHFHTFTIFYSG